MDESSDWPEAYTYFTVVGDERQPFDPDAWTQRTGLIPSASRRRGDITRPGARPLNHDRWSIASPLPHTEPLDAQIDALFLELHRAWESLRGLVDSTFDRNAARAGRAIPPGAMLQFVIYGEQQTMRLQPRQVRDCAELGMRIDCDAYLSSEQRFVDGRCANCGIASPATFAQIAHRVGGYVETSECKLQLWIDDVDPKFARECYEVDASWDESGTDWNHARVAYISETRQLLFASGVVPLPGGTEFPTINAWIASFTDLLSGSTLPRDTTRTFVLSITNRGAGGGFHLEPESVRRIAALEAEWQFHLDTRPAQQFSVRGECWSCSFNVLTNSASHDLS